MASRVHRLCWLTVASGVFWAAGTSAQEVIDRQACPVHEHWTADRLPLDQMPRGLRERVREVVDKPTLYTSGPTEVFACRAPLYFWFLDHPDRAVVVWHRLGAQCVEITPRGDGSFGWTDGQGSELHWQTVFASPKLRVWYAEGNVKPALLAPTVLVRAVVVLRHLEGKDTSGKTFIKHQADLILHTDSKTAALAAKLLGPSMPRLADHYVAQMELFFSGVSWYLSQHPERAQQLLGSGATE